MNTDERLNRLEAMLRALLDNLNPQMGFREIHRLLGYKSTTTTYAWLAARKIPRVGKGWRRVDVIANAPEIKR